MLEPEYECIIKKITTSNLCVYKDTVVIGCMKVVVDQLSGCENWWKVNYCYLKFEDREWQRKDRPAQSKNTINLFTFGFIVSQRMS